MIIRKGSKERGRWRHVQVGRLRIHLVERGTENGPEKSIRGRILPVPSVIAEIGARFPS